MNVDKNQEKKPGKGASMLIGAHVSAAGDISHALANGEEIGASCIQIFSRNQRSWVSPPISDEEAERFRQAWAESSIEEVMVHDSYLINLGGPDPKKHALSLKAFSDEVFRCEKLGIRLLNFHPGAHVGSGEKACLNKIVESLLSVMEKYPVAGVVYTLENTAGQGSSVGSKLEELAFILENVGVKMDVAEKMGVCLDTCHLYGAGYDLTEDEGWKSFWEEFERLIGFSFLKAIHLNDSKKTLGSRLDRHEELGRGHIGEGFFRRLASDSHFESIPMFLETPEGAESWKREIAMMREFRENI